MTSIQNRGSNTLDRPGSTRPILEQGQPLVDGTTRPPIFLASQFTMYIKPIIVEKKAQHSSKANETVKG
jgi:hypothetical protein